MIRLHTGRASIALAAFLLLCVAARGAVSCAAEAELAAAPYSERWLYCSSNLQVDRSVDDLTALFDRAKRSGYTGILFSDYKLQVLDRVTRQLLSERRKDQVGRRSSRPRAGAGGLLDRLQQRPPGARPQPGRRPAGRRPAVCRQEPRRTCRQERRPRKTGERRAATGSGGRARLEAGRPDSQRRARRNRGRPVPQLLVPGRPRSRDVRRSLGLPRRPRLMPSRAGTKDKGILRPTCGWSSGSPFGRTRLIAFPAGSRPKTSRRPGRFTCWRWPRARTVRRSRSMKAGSSRPRTGRKSTSSSTAWKSAKSTSTRASGAKEKGLSGSTTWLSKSLHSSTS